MNNKWHVYYSTPVDRGSHTGLATSSLTNPNWWIMVWYYINNSSMVLRLMRMMRTEMEKHI